MFMGSYNGNVRLITSDEYWIEKFQLEEYLTSSRFWDNSLFPSISTSAECLLLV
jgi:hypothetical protein